MFRPSGRCASHDDQSAGHGHADHVPEGCNPLRIVFEAFACYRRIKTAVRSIVVLTHDDKINILAYADIDAGIVASGKELPYRTVYIQATDLQHFDAGEVLWKLILYLTNEIELPLMRHSDRSISLVVATWFHPDWAQCVASWNDNAYLVPSLNIVDAYQHAFAHLRSDILGYVHDDLICHDQNWHERVMAEFTRDVAVVGFAGAPGHGAADMYQGPFRIPSMGRIGMRSNLRDAEKHGARFTGSCNVAVLDGLAIFVRNDFLASIGGWPVTTPVDYYTYAEWLCCMARRHKRRIRLVGVDCDHLRSRSINLNPDFNPDPEAECRYIYEEFRDVLPERVEP